MTDKKQNEVSESKEIPHEINSVSDLSQILQTLGEPKEGHTRFFRGHGDESWQMLPSIYRETYLIENEDKIIKDALTYCPDDFLPSNTLFEKLVKLQHYGCYTRLLDLTANALVALYFAASPSSNKDGELIILDIPDAEIKYGDSDTVAILSALSLQSNQLNILPLIILADRAKNMEERKIEIERQNDYNKFGDKKEEFANNVLKQFDFPYNWKTINEITRIERIHRVFIESFNMQREIISLLHDIQTDKPSFRPVIEPSDLQRVICVRAKLNNQRISRQQGCFLLFGIKGSKTKAAVIPDEWQRLASNRQKVLVKADRKDAIKKELESFGISKRPLFPELEAQAKEIMDYYKGQK